MSQEQPIKRGWFYPPTTRRAHYFNNEARSLCNGYLLLLIGQLDAREFEDFGHESPDNCARCKRLRADLEFPTKAEADND